MRHQKASFYAHPDETEFLVFVWEHKQEKYSSMKRFEDVGSARDHFEQVVGDLLYRTSRSMVQCYLC